MTSNVKQFNVNLRRQAKVLPADTIRRVQRKLGLLALRRIVKRTPVDTGRARGNWQTTIGTLPTATVETVDKTGGGAIEAGAGVMAHLPDFAALYIGNNLPYIGVLEHGGYQPPDPEDTEEANKRRAWGRTPAQRASAAAERGHEGAPLVQAGYSIKAPRGMVGITFEELKQVALSAAGSVEE